jgi:F0F1-type ATP synthase membrane subunit b/b'
VDRLEANKERERTLEKAREQFEATIQAAQVDLNAQVEAAKRDLAPASQALAGEIVEVVLDNKPSSLTPGGARP